MKLLQKVQHHIFLKHNAITCGLVNDLWTSKDH